MSKVINSALELIGNTPLLNASRYAKNAGIEGVTLLTKLEYLNAFRTKPPKTPGCGKVCPSICPIQAAGRSAETTTKGTRR